MGGGDPVRLAEMAELAESARRSGWLSQARAGFLGLAEAAERDGDRPALVQAALGVGGLWVHEQREVVARARVHALWEKAQRAAPSGSLDEARLRVRLAAEAVYEGAPADPVEAAVEAVAAFGHDSATAEALSLLHHVRLGPGHAEARLRLAEEILRLGARAGDAALTLMGLCWRTVDLFLLGSPRASQSLAELRQRAAAEGCEALAFISDVLGAMTLARAGRLPEAESAATAAAERGNKVGDPDAGAYFGAMLAALRWWQGRADEVVQVVREISTSPQLGFNDHVYVAADALLSVSLGDRDSADEALARLSAIGLSRLPDSSSWLTTHALVAEAAYLLGDAQLAGEAGQLLAPFAHLPVMPSLAVVCLGSAERALGLAAATTGRLDAAVHHLDAAVAADRRLASRPILVLTEHTLAGVLRARGAPGDEARAAQLARRSQERAASMGIDLPPHPAWLCESRPIGVRTRMTRSATLEIRPGGLRVIVEQRTSVLPPRVGFSYLAELIRHARQDLDVMALTAIDGVCPPASPDTVLDAGALRTYRLRVRELTAALARADLAPSAVARYNRELEAVSAALRSATGLGGRPRSFPDIQERARTAARKALMRAVAAIEEVEPDLGRHLGSSLTTGATCRYTPSPGWCVTVQRSVDRS